MAANEDLSLADGGTGGDGLAEFILGDDVEVWARFHNGRDALLGDEINFPISGNR